MKLTDTKKPPVSENGGGYSLTSEGIMTRIKLDCNADHDIKMDGYTANGTAWVVIDDISVEFSFRAKLKGERWQDYDGSMISELTSVYSMEVAAGDAWLVDSDGDTIDEVTYDLQAAHKAGVIEAIEAAIYEAEAA